MADFNDRRFKDPVNDIAPDTGVGPFHKPGMPRNGQPMGTFRGVSKPEKPKSTQPTGTFSGTGKPGTKSGQPTGTFRGVSKPEKPKNNRLMGQLNK